jgi:hypothetical protein
MKPTYNIVRIGTYLYTDFSTHNGLRHGEALWSLSFNFSLEHTIRRVQEIQLGLKLWGTYQLLVCADNMGLPDGNIDMCAVKL